MISLLIFLTISQFFIVLAMWSRRFEKCIKCGTWERKHVARGLCVLCYRADIEKRHTKHQRGLRIAAQILTKAYLVEHYLEGKQSLSDIAEKCGCSRQYVYKKMREYGILLRNKQSARDLALRQGKIRVEINDNIEQKHVVTYQRIEYNSKFFATWSSEMAYVLGVLYTDGCLHIESHASKSGIRHQSVLSMAQKEPELLLKVLALMNCNVKLTHRQRKKYGAVTAGAVYSFGFVCTLIYPDLTRLGLKPRKSLDITYPSIPTEYVRHFIRGCWDGDGSVYYEKCNDRISASFVSGSLAFIQGIVKELTKAGLPPRTIHTRKSNTPSYYFRYTGEQCRDYYIKSCTMVFLLNSCWNGNTRSSDPILVHSSQNHKGPSKVRFSDCYSKV